MDIAQQIEDLADTFAASLQERVDERVREMADDDRSHYLIYRVLGVTGAALKRAARNKGGCKLVVVATHTDLVEYPAPADVTMIPSTSMALLELVCGQAES